MALILPDALAASVSRETALRLEAFASVLTIWNRRVNLIGGHEGNRLWARHIADALQLAHLVNKADGDDAADIGSGAGFPGLVLAIATQRCFHLIESDQRKAAFLREAARVSGAPVVVHATRAESLAGSLVFPLVTARGVAPLADLLASAVPLLADGGICVFPKGCTAEDELTAARARWHMHVDSFPSQTDPHGRILRIRDICRAVPG